jgi:CheY-like chemotaxis protein
MLFNANGGHDALEKLNNHHSDMLLMDIEMTEMDGKETTKF